MDLYSGAIRWTFRAAGGHLADPATDGSTVFITRDLGAQAVALDLATGRVVWMRTIQTGAGHLGAVPGYPPMLLQGRL